jgi:outer membrane protein assembly factor BamB
MRRSSHAPFLAAVTLAATVASAADADSPMFRGSDRTGVSKETGLLKQWPENGPALAWKADGVGVGFSSVSASGGTVYTMGDAGGACYLFALGRAGGEKKWERKVGPAGGGGGYPGPRCTPATDGELVFALGQNGDLVCAAASDGAERWRKSLVQDFGGSCGGWGYAESPLLDGGNLVVTPGGSRATMVALDKKTGRQVWAGVIPGGDTAGYSSAVVANFGGVKQYVQLTAGGLASFAATNGKLLWRYGTGGDRFGRNTANIPTPVVRGDYVFASAGYGRGGALVKIVKTGDTFTPQEVYWNNRLNNKHGGVILVGDKLYGDEDDGGRVWCADFMTGKVLWSRRERGSGSGSATLTYADGRLYIRYQDGWVVLADAATDRYTELSAFRVPNGRSNCWAHPVVAGGRLFVREREAVWCYDVSAK